MTLVKSLYRFNKIEGKADKLLMIPEKKEMPEFRKRERDESSERFQCKLLASNLQDTTLKIVFAL
jgi:hypothetical protein